MENRFPSAVRSWYPILWLMGVETQDPPSASHYSASVLSRSHGFTWLSEQISFPHLKFFDCRFISPRWWFHTTGVLSGSAVCFPSGWGRPESCSCCLRLCASLRSRGWAGGRSGITGTKARRNRSVGWLSQLFTIIWKYLLCSFFYENHQI